MEEQSADKEQQSTDYMNDYDAPIEVKSVRLRKNISKQVNKKLYALLSRQATGKEISYAHSVINKRVGIDKTDDSTAIELLDKKLEYINNTRAQSWK